MSTPEHLETLIEAGHALMARERSVLLRGDFDQLGGLTADKRGLLDALDDSITRVKGTEPVRAALAGLIADSRRNEAIILAARQGLSGARRQIEAIIATGRGAVAYDRDGSAITSRDDTVRRSSRA